MSNEKTYLLLVIILLASCTNQPPIEQQNSTHIRQPIKVWDLNARLFVSDNKQSGTVNLHWRQNNDDYQIRFVLPFLQGSYTLQKNSESGISLLTAKNRLLQADDATELLLQTTGLYVPIDSFKYWVRGLSNPGMEIIGQQFDTHQRLVEMQQGGWNISIKRYTNVNGLDLPSKIFAVNEQFRLKLSISHWDLHP